MISSLNKATSILTFSYESPPRPFTQSQIEIPVQVTLNPCIFYVICQQTFRSQSLTTSPSTATGFASMVKVQVRVGEQETPQFSRLATLAGVTPPMTAADLHSAEQKQLRSQSHRERSPAKSDGTSKWRSLLSVCIFEQCAITIPG